MYEIYERYWKKLLTVSMQVSNSLEEAEECVQDIFANLWKIREKIQLQHTLHTYLSAAVKYRSITIMARRSRATRQVLLQPLTSEPISPAADEHICCRELQHQIESGILQLPQKAQTVFRLSRENGLSNKQIAQHLGITEKAVEANITRALKDLKNCLATTAHALLLLL